MGDEGQEKGRKVRWELTDGNCDKGDGFSKKMDEMWAQPQWRLRLT